MDRATDGWIKSLEPPKRTFVEDVKRLRLSYTIYGSLLLLSHNAFQTPPWQELRTQLTDDDFTQLYELLAKHLKITHIAINQPIPLHNNGAEEGEENIIRAPQNFTPLHGDFGPTTCSSQPTQEDFDAAFWVTAKQNDIYQTWAPRWTMFSRGNISEKTRLLSLPSILDAVEQGRSDGKGCAAVDLYAGIGYFAFSYLKAGVEKVVCWDLNAWSVEGMRRGAAANKWKIVVYEDAEGAVVERSADVDARLLVFNELNQHAASRIERLRNVLPPVRHVNCGLLPTSRGSWQTAVDVLDERLGGWVHVHENFGVQEIEAKAEEVRATFEHMIHSYGHAAPVKLEGIHQLKSYAPGVMHCVLDISIPPLNLPSP